MDKKSVLQIRGMLGKLGWDYYKQKPAPPPLKSQYLARMYQIESCIDIAVNWSFNNQTKMRKRGYWQWVQEEEGLNMGGNEEKPKSTNGDTPNGDVNESEVAEEPGAANSMLCFRVRSAITW